MKRTTALKALAIGTALALTTGCASNGSMEDYKAKFADGARSVGGAVGDVAGKAVGAAKQVGGNLVPGDYITGVHVSEEALAQMSPGMTQGEVEALIGPAPDVIPSSEGDVWKYPYARIPHFGQNVNETTVVRFGKNQRLVKAYKVDGGGAANSGNPLLEAAEAGGHL